MFLIPYSASVYNGLSSLFEIVFGIDGWIIMIILAVLMNLGIWVVKPLFNPQFLSSNSAMIIITIMFYGIYYNEKLAVSEKTKQ